MSERTLLTIGVAAVLGIVAGASTLAVAQFNPWNNNNVNMRSLTDNWSSPNTVAQLASNEGIFVDVKEFKINKGVAKGDPQTQIAKSGAREVSEGAIIVRSGASFTSSMAGRRSPLSKPPLGKWSAPERVGAPVCRRCIPRRVGPSALYVNAPSQGIVLGK